MTNPAEAGAVRSETTGAITTITIDRAERRNAINADVVAGIARALTAAEADEATRVVVLTGSGDRAFSAGGDLADASADSGRRRFVRTELAELLDQMRRSTLPLIARVNGHALGGGFGLMLACDLVIACDDVKLGTPEINIGLWPFIISAVVQRDVPRKVALELMLTGKTIDPAEARLWGFVNRVVPRDALDREVNDLAAEIAGKSSLILSLGKGSFYRATDMTWEPALRYLAGMLALCLQSEDTAEGVSAFLQKRPPQWRDR